MAAKPDLSEDEAEREFWNQPQHPDSIVDLRGIPYSLRHNEADRLILLYASVKPLVALLTD